MTGRKLWTKSDLKDEPWPFQYFSLEEFKCKGSGYVAMDHELLSRLDLLRHNLGLPLYVVSGYRSENHNKNVGGAKNSYHLKGQAVDIAWARMNAREKRRLLQQAQHVGFGGLGFYSTFVHLDTGPDRLWVG